MCACTFVNTNMEARHQPWILLSEVIHVAFEHGAHWFNQAGGWQALGLCPLQQGRHYKGVCPQTHTFHIGLGVECGFSFMHGCIPSVISSLMQLRFAVSCGENHKSLCSAHLGFLACSACLMVTWGSLAALTSPLYPISFRSLSLKKSEATELTCSAFPWV